MQSMFNNVREYLTPVLSESNYYEKGVLTPEEFVKAGDQLIYKCPTWRWEAGDESCRKTYLPPTKQFLVTKNVPCRTRVESLEKNYMAEVPVETNDDEDEGWLATHSNTQASASNKLQNEEDDLEDISSCNEKLTYPPPAPAVNILSGVLVNEHFNSNSDSPNTSIPDMGSFEDDDNLIVNEADDESCLVAVTEPDADNHILNTRTYDLSITYDKYYQTPRVWLFGYNEDGGILNNDEIFEDIMQDYQNQTVTMESHPHYSQLVTASIHPCQHSSVMKRILRNIYDRKNNEDKTKDIDKEKHVPRADQYLFIFLKFIQSVIPTIDYDYTMEVQAK